MVHLISLSASAATSPGLNCLLSCSGFLLFKLGVTLFPLSIPLVTQHFPGHGARRYSAYSHNHTWRKREMKGFVPASRQNPIGNFGSCNNKQGNGKIAMTSHRTCSESQYNLPGMVVIVVWHCQSHVFCWYGTYSANRTELSHHCGLASVRAKKNV